MTKKSQTRTYRSQLADLISNTDETGEMDQEKNAQLDERLSNTGSGING